MLKPEDVRYIGQLVEEAIASSGGSAAPAAAPTGFTGTFEVPDGSGGTKTVTVQNGIIKSVA